MESILNVLIPAAAAQQAGAPSGGELGLMWLSDNHFVSLTGLYGHRKEWCDDWSQTLETDAGVRLAVGVRFLGGK